MNDELVAQAVKLFSVLPSPRTEGLPSGEKNESDEAILTVGRWLVREPADWRKVQYVGLEKSSATPAISLTFADAELAEAQTLSDYLLAQTTLVSSLIGSSAKQAELRVGSFEPGMVTLLRPQSATADLLAIQAYLPIGSKIAVICCVTTAQELVAIDPEVRQVLTRAQFFAGAPTNMPTGGS